ncbi:MAG TPA: methyltransferase domain-containing protein [Terriglobales bacterium]|nr:methyltransferase domain-containing protein [Terriglobales bacterium]
MRLTQILASQLRHPKGWLGRRIFSRGMNVVNRRLIDRTLELLELEPQHRVLEIGFGGGASLGILLDRLGAGKIEGVDASPDMVQQAQRRFRQQIALGRLQAQLADAGQLPFSDCCFDRVFTVNTIYFWPDTMQGLREILRVLNDGGRAAIALRSREKMEKHAVTQYGFRLFSPQEVADIVSRAGFHDVTVDHRNQEKAYDDVVVMGHKSRP